MIFYQLINKYHLENIFYLIGLRENPYPYIKQADILVQPSKFEGKSVVLDEAKILFKSIIVTNYNSAGDQIVNDESGIIVPMNGKGIAEGLINLIINENKRRELSEFLKNNIDSTIYDIDNYMNTLCI